LIHILTNILKENRMVVNATLVPIVILLAYVSEVGFTKLDVTPGGGFDAGIKVGVGVAIFHPDNSNCCSLFAA
jgi:hypothetical protein